MHIKPFIVRHSFLVYNIQIAHPEALVTEATTTGVTFFFFFFGRGVSRKSRTWGTTIFYYNGHKHLATIFTAPPMTDFGFPFLLCFPYPCLCVYVWVGAASCQSTPAWLSTTASIQARPPLHTYLSLPVSPRQFVPPARVLTTLWLLSIELPSASHHAVSSQPFSTIQPSVSALGSQTNYNQNVTAMTS